jgi:hypothetical protein
VASLLQQAQLLNVALDPQDVVYTPDWVAADMVAHFKPSGRVVEPCKGEGVFMKYLPAAEWCEIAEGKDFFKFVEPVDYLFGNPPYKIFSKWMDHSMSIAQNIVYLIPLNKTFNSGKFLLELKEWGFPVHMRYYGTGSELGFPIGFAAGAVHFKRGYRGAMGFSYASTPPNTACSGLAGTAARESEVAQPANR